MIFGVTSPLFALGFDFLMSLQTGVPFGRMLTISIPTGFMFGLLFGLIMAAFLKADTITVNIRDRDDFVSRINVAMSQIGFYPETGSGNFLIFKPSFWAGLMSGRFSIVIQGSKATIVGPSKYLKNIQKRFV